MLVVTTLKNAYIKYDDTEGAYILHLRDETPLAILELISDNTIPVNDYIEVSGQPDFNYIKINRCNVRLLDGRLIISGNIQVLK